MKSFKVVYEKEDKAYTVVVNALSKDYAADKVRQPGVKIIKVDEFNGGSGRSSSQKAHSSDTVTTTLIIGLIWFILSMIAFVVLIALAVNGNEVIRKYLWVPIVVAMPGSLMAGISFCIKFGVIIIPS